MSALQLLLTNAGLAAYTAAQLSADIDLALTEIGLSNTDFVLAPTLTALPGEFKRIDTLNGKVVGQDVVHMTVADQSADTYEVRGFGVFLADGTLFGVYSQAQPMAEKSTASMFLLAIDVKFPPGQVAEITFGDANFLYPPATETEKGVAEIATQAETDAGADDARIVTPKKLAARTATEGRTGIAELATQTETDAGTDDTRIVTPKKLAARISAIVQTLSDAIATRALAARQVLGAGLAIGGGDLTADRTITVTAATAAEADAGALATKALTPASLVNVLASIASKAAKAITVTGGGLVSGGGDLSANRTLTVAKATLTQLRALTDDTAAVTPAGLGQLVRSHAQNGYQEHPGGLLVMWGRFTATGNTTTSVSFPLAFPSACYVVVAGGGNSNTTEGDNMIELLENSITPSGFQVSNGRAESLSGTFWAVGK